MKIFSIMVMAFLMVTSCGNTPKKDQLSGAFKIIALNENTELPENLTINFDAETNKVFGFSGCNNFTGSFTLEKGKLSLTKMATTRKMCPGSVNKIESEILTLLSKINHYSVKDNTLSLEENDKVLIKATH